MLVVFICSLFNGAMIIGLLCGIVIGTIKARAAIADALAFDGLTPATARTARLLRA